MKWQDNGNLVLKSSEGWYLSYNPLTQPVETALVAEGGMGYYILNGDHRKELEKHIDSWQDSYGYIVAHKEQLSVHSSPV